MEMVQILDLLYPKVCLGCRKWGRYVCERCQVGLLEEEQICPGCGRASRYGLRHRDCERKGTLVGVTCFWEYGGLVKKLIEEAKYAGYFDCLEEFSVLSFQLANRDEFGYFRRFLETKPVVVPVPLFKKRERERGFNQAWIISQLAGNNWHLICQNLLMRTKDTGHQVGRDRKERLLAMNNAFKLNDKCQMIHDTCLLVDDVWTTGATMQAAAQALKDAGVERVWGLVLAR